MDSKHVKFIVHYRCIDTIQTLIRLPFSNSALAALRKAASHCSKSSSVPMKGKLVAVA